MHLQKAFFAKGCHLSSPSQSAHSLPHSSFTVLLPSSFSCVSLIFEALSCSFVMTEHSSAPQLYCRTLLYFTYPAFTSGLWSLQLCPQGGCPLPPHQKCTTFPFFTTCFLPLSFYGESPRLVTPLLPAFPAAYAQHSKWEEVATEPTQAGGHSYLLQAPIPWEGKCCCCSCHHPRSLVRKLIHRMRVPSIAVLCCLPFVLLLCLPAASPSFVPSGESGNL